MRAFTLPSLVALSLPVAAWAETTRPVYVPPPTSAVSSGSVLQVIFSLFLVLGAVVLVGWLLRRINMPQQGGAHVLKVISGVSVGQRERVILIEVNDTWLVVGVAPGQVNTLHTLPKSELDHQHGDSTGHGEANKFQGWLKQMMEKRNA